MDLAEKLIRLLADRDWNQADLARVAKMHPSRINKWMKGNGSPSIKQAIQLADALGVPLSWLVDEREKYPPPSPLSEDETVILRLLRDLDPADAIRRLSRNEGAKVVADEDMTAKQREMIRAIRSEPPP